MPVAIIVRNFSDDQITEVETAVNKSGAKSREAWAKHTLLKAAGVKEPLVKKKGFKRQKNAI